MIIKYSEVQVIYKPSKLLAQSPGCSYIALHGTPWYLEVVNAGMRAVINEAPGASDPLPLP